MREPTVSVVVPVFNCERWLADALDSIFGQAWPALDVIVVDDGSTDGSARIASRYPVRLLAVEHGGIARARNAGVGAARGDLVTFLDADDVWTRDSLRPRVERMLECPELDALLGLVELFIEPGTPRPAWYRPSWDTEPQQALLQGLLARRRAFDLVGGFDPSYEVGEDTDWFARFTDSGLRSERWPEVVARYRRHDGNITNEREQIGASVLRTVKASLDRKRDAMQPGGGSSSR